MVRKEISGLRGEWSSWGVWKDSLIVRRDPELAVCRRWPAETLGDGELVDFDAGDHPDLPGLLRRHGLTEPWRISQARRRRAVRYGLFDLVYHADGCPLGEPLARRREVLAGVCARLDTA